MAMLAIALVGWGGKSDVYKRLAIVCIFLCAVASIMVTGARGGVVALVVAGCYGLIISGRYRVSNTAFITVATIFSILFGLQELIPEILLRRIDLSGGFFDFASNLSAGRIDTYFGGIEIWKQAPIFGVGPGNAKIFVNNSQFVNVHNVWIRLLAEGGIFLFLSSIIVFFLILGMVFNRKPHFYGYNLENYINWPNGRLVIISGLVLSLVEPQVIFGSFNANATFWTAVWLVLIGKRKMVGQFYHTSGR
ncbi:MAG: O-antigen ligase family protein [Mesorhizobium sp.]